MTRALRFAIRPVAQVKAKWKVEEGGRERATTMPRALSRQQEGSKVCGGYW